MAQATLLSIAQQIAKRLMWNTPATVISNTDNNVVLLLSMIEQTIDEIGNSFAWPELRKQHLFPLIDGLANYPQPGDYDRSLDDTQWNRDQRWPLIGPIDPVTWQQLQSGLISQLPMQRYRVMGADLNQFYITPTPSSDDSGNLAVYEYIAQQKRRPKTWVANTAYTTADYVWSNGLILKCSSNGTSANRAAGFPQAGLDNTTFWESVPAFVASGNYYAGEYILSNSKVYHCTTTGKASATGPSDTGSSPVTNGTAAFQYISTPGLWVGGTNYTSDGTSSDFVVNSLADAYRCAISGQSGQYEPTFRKVLGATGFGQPPTYSTTTITDGTAVWTVQTGGWPTFLADTDLCVLDQQAIVDGAVWRILEDRGFDYQEKRRMAEDELEIIKGKLIGASSVSYNLDTRLPWMIGVWSYPEQGFGS